MALDSQGVLLKIFEVKTGALLIARPCTSEDSARVWFDHFVEGRNKAEYRYTVSAMVPRI